jgi:hypothetical protein
MFCGGGPLSREHAIPRWLVTDPYFADFVSNYQPTERFRPLMTAITEDAVAIHIDRQGTPKLSDIAIRAVCHSCNNGWMSQLEVEVAKPLRALMTGATTMLSGADALVIARWAVKTSTTFQLTDKKTATVNQQQLAQILRADSVIPGFAVFAARYEGSRSIWPCHGRMNMVLQEDWRVQVGVAGVTTLVFGELALAVFSGSNADALERCLSEVKPEIQRWHRIPGPSTSPIELRYKASHEAVYSLSGA